MDELNRLRSEQAFTFMVGDYGCLYACQPICSMQELCLLGQNILAQKIYLGDTDKEGNGWATLIAGQGYAVRAYVQKLSDICIREPNLKQC